MKEERRRGPFWAALALLALTAGFLLAVFSMLNKTELYEIYLWDSAGERSGWSYEILQDGELLPVEPEFPDEWSAVLPGGDVQAMRMSRTMTERLSINDNDVIYPILAVEPYDSRVEVLLDGQLLAADVQGAQRDENGFLILTERDRQAMLPEYRSVTVTLPEDYLGRTLTINVYYAQPRQDPVPPYPKLYSDQMQYASSVVGSVPESAMLTVYALLTLLVLSVFAMDARNGRPDWPMVLLALYFLMLFLDKAYNSTAGTLSVLYDRMNLSFFTGLYIAPLFLYLALRFTGGKRIFLSAAASGWALFEAAVMFRAIRRGEVFMSLSYGGLGAYLLILLFGAAFALEYVRRWRRSKDTRIPRSTALLTAAVAAGELLYGARQWGGGSLRSYVQVLLRSMVSELDGFPSFMPFVNFVMDTCSVMAVLLLLGSFVRRTIRTRETIGVLSERARLTMEGYERMLRSEEATSAVRHEMRHHMTALAGILREGDVDRAGKYVAAVDSQLERLPTGRYSPNILVNVIAGTYLDRAREEGIEVEHSLSLPETLPIPDEELSVFLTNMLENALQACQRMDPSARRYIRVKMHLHENSLFIGCVNSTADEQGQQTERTGREHRRHGYGLEAMGRIAEKYSSILAVDRRPGEFSVQSNLYLTGR